MDAQEKEWTCEYLIDFAVHVIILKAMLDAKSIGDNKFATGSSYRVEVI